MAESFSSSSFFWCFFFLPSMSVRLWALTSTASLRGMRKLRAKPFFTSMTSPRLPTFSTSAVNMTFMMILFFSSVKRINAICRARLMALDSCFW